MTDDRHRSDYRPPVRQPQPGELLWEFHRERDHTFIRCELRDRGEWGVEVQIFEGDFGIVAHLFRPGRGEMGPRAAAIAWAEAERRAIE